MWQHRVCGDLEEPNDLGQSLCKGARARGRAWEGFKAACVRRSWVIVADFCPSTKHGSRFVASVRRETQQSPLLLLLLTIGALGVPYCKL